MVAISPPGQILPPLAQLGNADVHGRVHPADEAPGTRGDAIRNFGSDPGLTAAGSLTGTIQPRPSTGGVSVGGVVAGIGVGADELADFLDGLTGLGQE